MKNSFHFQLASAGQKFRIQSLDTEKHPAAAFSRMVLFVLLFSLVSLTFTGGCKSYSKNVFKAREAFYCSNLDGAIQTIEEEKKKSVNAKNRDVLKLEEAMMHMCQGNFQQSETLLREVRDSFETLENQKLKTNSEKALTMLTDDCAASYPGEDYEKVLIQVMLALNSLMKDGYDTRAYAHQINLKQEQIIEKSEKDPETGEKVKKSYRNLAIGPYICGILDDQNVSAQQEQIANFTKVTQWSPNFIGGQEMLLRAQNGKHSEKGNGVVYVFALMGHGPYKREVNAEVTQAALLISDILISATSKHSVTPTIAPVPIPEITLSPVRYRAAKVSVDDEKSVLTEEITNINTMAVEQFEVNRPWIIARAAARRALKKAGLYGVKEAAGVHSAEGELLVDLIGILWEASEEADTRCWNLLPGSIQVARLELPAGEHNLKLEPSMESFVGTDPRLAGASRFASVSFAGTVPPPPHHPPHHQPHHPPHHPPHHTVHHPPHHPQHHTAHYPAPRTEPMPSVSHTGLQFGPQSGPRAAYCSDSREHTHKVWKTLLQNDISNAKVCHLPVTVQDGKNTYVFVYFGDYGLIGKPHASTY